MRLINFAGRSLKQKQIIILTLTSSAALLLASACFVVFELMAVKQEMRNKLSALAYHIGQETSAPYSMGDKESTQKFLAAAIAGDSTITAACLYNSNNTPFA